MIRRILSKLPKIRGMHRALTTLDAIRGPTTIEARSEVRIEGFYSSMQDMAFLKSVPDNALLEAEISKLPSDGIFVDCGANCGFYSALASKKLGENGVVLSIEPSTREYRRLLSAIKLNKHKNQWIPINLAAGEANGHAVIDDAVGHTGMNRISQATTANPSKTTILMMRLDSLLPLLISSNSRISLLKIDVEGFEYKVLRGLEDYLKKGLIDKIIVEITERFLIEHGDSKELLYEYVGAFGYSPSVSSTQWQYDEIFSRTGQLPHRP